MQSVLMWVLWLCRPMAERSGGDQGRGAQSQGRGGGAGGCPGVAPGGLHLPSQRGTGHRSSLPLSAELLRRQARLLPSHLLPSTVLSANIEASLCRQLMNAYECCTIAAARMSMRIWVSGMLKVRM